MNLASLLLGGLLVAGVVVAGDDHLTKLMKKLHGGGHDFPAAAEPDAAPLSVLYEAVGRLGLPEDRLTALHESLLPLAAPIHVALGQVLATRDAQVRATLKVPFDALALQQASENLGIAELTLAKATASLHAVLRGRLSDADLAAFDAAVQEQLSGAEAEHAEFRRMLETGAHGKFHDQR